MLNFIFWQQGIFLLIIGIIFKLYPPASINSLYGYRTKSSMRDEVSWNLANAYSSKLLVYFSSAIVVLQFILWILFGVNTTTILISGGAVLIAMITLLILTERKLNNKK